MNEKYFRTPFAEQGDITDVPEARDSNGFVSYTEGWGPDYQKDLTSEPTAKPVERTVMNAVLLAVTTVLKGYQEYGYPEFIPASANAGVPFPYAKGVIVRYRPNDANPYVLYMSMSDGNTDTPLQGEANRWGAISKYEPGQIVYTAGKRALPGTLPCDGRAVSRALYPRLFDEIGTIYGAGDGATTFNIPNFPEGTVGVHTGIAAQVGTFAAGQVISHTHAASTDSVGAHAHALTINAGGDHAHNASSTAAGDHAHVTWTDAQGWHQHTGGTTWNGDHQHGGVLPSSGHFNGYGIYHERDSDATPTDGYTAVAGGHSHAFTTDGNGSHAHNIGMNGSGNHAHTISVALGGNHTHTATAASGGLHTHAVTIVSTGASYNFAAGLRVIACIAY